MTHEQQTICVYADWSELTGPVLMGYLHVQYARGKEVFSFEFNPDWLTSRSPFTLDPNLQFFSGRQYANQGKALFGIFLDSCPDRWGRMLIRRREAIKARQDGRPVKKLAESDYLLAVHDETRMGALRFNLDESSVFENSDQELSTPPWTSLRELETACRRYEENIPDSEHDKWISMLIAPGSSLGGARPKANVLDEHGNLWIAKFPSRADKTDSGAWEMVAYKLAAEIGLNIPSCRLEQFSKYGSTFLSKRFDRNTEKRIHFASAMTLLGKSDGDNFNTGCSYLDIAQFIVQQGVNPNEDLLELWKRLVFSIAISNTDDHLRNHGFLMAPQGWQLSPAFDINPNVDRGGLSLNISMDDNSLDFDLALSVSPQFRLSSQQAVEEISRIRNVVASWKEVARNLHIPRHQIEDMSPAFLQE
jgi:serine/threonine-protein kinase HipA